jgi:hypothetical protein
MLASVRLKLYNYSPQLIDTGLRRSWSLLFYLLLNQFSACGCFFMTRDDL